jgi:predicted transcriptional regulator
MAGRTISTHLDDETVLALKAVAAAENRPTSQLVGTGLRSFIKLSPAARRALYALESTANEEHLTYVGRLLSRELIVARRRFVEHKIIGNENQDVLTGTNNAIRNEDDIEAVASRLCAQ